LSRRNLFYHYLYRIKEIHGYACRPGFSLRSPTLLRRSALLLILGQSLLFVAVLLITMARGLKIDCGCGLFFQRQVGLASVLEDGVLLLLTGVLYWRERRLQFD